VLGEPARGGAAQVQGREHIAVPYNERARADRLIAARSNVVIVRRLTAPRPNVKKDACARSRCSIPGARAQPEVRPLRSRDPGSSRSLVHAARAAGTSRRGGSIASSGIAESDEPLRTSASLSAIGGSGVGSPEEAGGVPAREYDQWGKVIRERASRRVASERTSKWRHA